MHFCRANCNTIVIFNVARNINMADYKPVRQWLKEKQLFKIGHYITASSFPLFLQQFHPIINWIIIDLFEILQNNSIKNIITINSWPNLYHSLIKWNRLVNCYLNIFALVLKYVTFIHTCMSIESYLSFYFGVWNSFYWLEWMGHDIHVSALHGLKLYLYI